MDLDERDPGFTAVLRAAARADRDVVTMVNGAPDWDPPAALRDGLRDAAAVQPAEFQYPPVRGLRSLRTAIAERRNVDEAGVIVTGGATEANHIAMAHAIARGSGEEVIMADPYYPYYPRRTRLLDGRPVAVPVQSNGVLDPEAVAERATQNTAAIVVTTPNNPTGAVYKRSTLQQLITIAEEVDALLISDETYAHMDLSGEFVSALDVPSPNRVVTTSFSKSMAVTGLRVGYLVAPEGLRESLTDRHELTTIAASRPAQLAVLEALETTEPSYYEGVRSRLRERRATFTAVLDSLDATYTTPSMGFYVMARIPGLPGTTETVERLIEEVGIAPMPGVAFGEARADWLRFALVTPDVDVAAERLAEGVDALETKT